MSDVLINFRTEDASLDQAAAKLDKMTEAEKDLAAQAKKTYSDMDNSQKRIASSIDNMTKASKSLDKSIIAGAYKKYLQTIQKELGLTQKEVQGYIKIARQAAQQNILTEEDQSRVKEFEVSLSVLNDTLEEFSNKEDQTIQKTKTFRQEIREAEIALKEMYEAGKAGTPEFDQLQQKIGDLKDEYGDFQNTFKTLGSDTRSIDGLISLTAGLTGGFAAVQGAAALFGDENEDLQEALLKVNAAMSVLMGLQQLQAVLQKDSAAMILLTTIRTKAQTVATNIQTAATGAGTVATKALNVAMAASPIGLFIVGLTAAIAVLNSFADSAENATEQMDALNESADKWLDFYEKEAKTNQKWLDRNAEIKKNQELIKTLEVMGGNLSEINRLKNRNLQLEKVNTQVQLMGVKAAQEQAADKKRYTEQEVELKSKLYEQDQEINRNNIQLGKDQAAAAKEAADKRKQAAQEALENNKQILSERKALIEAELSELKRAGREEEDIYLQKQKAAIDAQAAIAAIDIKGINQRKAIFAKAEEDKDALVKSYQEKQTARQYEIDKKEIDARLSVVEEGSEAELILKKEALERDASNEQLAAANTIKNEKELAAIRIAIKTKLQSDLQKLDEEFAKKQLQNKTELSLINDQADILAKQRELIGVKDKAQISRINQEIIDIKLAGIEKEEALNEELYSKGLISEAEYLKAKAELNNKYLSEENTATQSAYDERERMIQAYYNSVNRQIESTFSLMASSLDETLINSEGLKSGLQSAMQVYAEFVKIQQSDATQAEKNRALAVAGIAAAQQTLNGVFAQAANERMAQLDAQLSALDEAKQRELDNKNLTEEQKSQIDEKYRKKEAAAKRAAWEADKRARRSQAVINTALAVVNALATAPTIIAGIALAAVAGVMGAVQVAKISNEPVPKFRHGKVNISGPGSDTSDSIPAMISRGESVINAKSTRKWEDALIAINNDKFEGWLDNRFTDFSFPEIPPMLWKSFEDRKNDGIDYDKLATAMAKHLPEATYIQNNFNEGDFQHWVTKGGNRTRFHNKRYSMK
ncbi:hypothetical protein ABDK00_014070 [Niabella insulamsoli]|uniref:hypothetical protein n=1 Tax=Niabella insulamsoli TaxID=3144874 RepID=UPI0031FC8D65